LKGPGPVEVSGKTVGSRRKLFCKPDTAINKILSYLLNYGALVTGSIL